MAQLVREGRIRTTLDREVWWVAMAGTEKLMLDFTQSTSEWTQYLPQVEVVHHGGRNTCASVAEAKDLDSRSRFEVTSIKIGMQRAGKIAVHTIDRQVSASVSQINVNPIAVITYTAQGSSELDINGFADISSAALEKYKRRLNPSRAAPR
ncbi:hypothetical protein ABH926_002457 [Catenulispora sp. GP43]|uniref:hypothetical protein n=1 Tax=Catenulispora sp. GP43 TaxID=3156263 RepID=UPI003515585A